MGCLGEEEKREALARFWKHQNSIRAERNRRRRRIEEAVEEADTAYERRVLQWAADNWELVGLSGGDEDSGNPEKPEGLFKVSYMLLPDDLKAALKEGRISASGEEDVELTAEQREKMETNVLYMEEKRRTGSPCPETAKKLKEINERDRQRGKRFINRERLIEINRRIVEASRVDDPLDLPRRPDDT